MVLKRPSPRSIVLFGASGDLTARKVMPALYNLFLQELLPSDMAIVGYARSDLDDSTFRARMRQEVAEHSRTGVDEGAWSRFSSALFFVKGGYDEPGAMDGLADRLVSLEDELGLSGERLFYCATPPSAFEQIPLRLAEAGLANRSRIVIEKPFGSDLASACRLNEVLHQAFPESQVFRIDHYLGKETVQNLLVFRFSNGMFEPIWNRRYVSMVQIDVAESDGIETRAKFYEEAGAIRDIVQNHMMQLLATLMMEPPAKFDAESIRDEKVKLLRSVPPIAPSDVARGQYVTGSVSSQTVAGYRQETGVPADSITETFAAIKVNIENWRWAGVPVFLRTGKRLPRRETTINVVFHDAPHMLFEESGIATPEPNHLAIRIQPNEGITLTFDAKVPGPEMKVTPVEMSFDYEESFMTQPAEAYERLLHDALDGDATLFTRADEIERCWQIVEPILVREPPEFYEAGSWGPPGSDRLLNGARWHLR